MPTNPSALLPSHWLRAHARRSWIYLLVLAIASCSSADESSSPTLGKVVQGLDTDNDGMDDAWETTHFGNLAQTASGDFDNDGMTNGEEHTAGLLPAVKDAFDDADGDRYPNVFEIRSGSDPNDAGSIPSSTYTVNASGGGTHTTISAALQAAHTQSATSYPIVAIAPGTYSGSGNVNISVPDNTKKVLIIGIDGAAKTIIDAGGTTWGWNIYGSAVVASLTFKRTWLALYVYGSGRDYRFVDLLVRDNGTRGYAAAVHVDAASSVVIAGSTLLNNTSTLTAADQVWVGNGTTTLVNTVLSGPGTKTMLAKATAATLVTNYCLVKGQTLSGTGNLAGSTPAKVNADGHLQWDSALRGAGQTGPYSRLDMDGETRPVGARDIGADYFNDTDADELPDRWETLHAGNLTTLTSRSQDADSDGLTNELEEVNDTNPTVADTDGDGLADGAEVANHFTNPRSNDTDGDQMPDGWEVANGLSPTVADAMNDDDGDRYPNIYEYLGTTNPTDKDAIPTPTYVVNAAGGGTHTTISAAVSAANAQTATAFPIIGIVAGTYSGDANATISIADTSKNILVVGLSGAASTIIDGGGTRLGWTINSNAIVASLTFQRTTRALFLSGSTKTFSLVDLLVRDNGTSGSAGAVHINSAANARIVGSTFLNNTSTRTVGEQIWIDSGALTLLNSVINGPGTKTMLSNGPAATLTTNHSFVRSQTLSGTGNVSGSTNPRLAPDGHLMWDSPLRNAGLIGSYSRLDMDGELRPTGTRDIGADQFVDVDGDEVPDQWEMAQVGNLTTLTSRSQDVDGDGIGNELEQLHGTTATVADTDSDGVSDGDEVTLHGTSPLLTDTDADGMPDIWEITYAIGAARANAYEDNDGDRYPNIFEYLYSSNPSNASSKPTPDYVVEPSGGGSHVSIKAALTTVASQTAANAIIGIAPGLYRGIDNVNLSTPASKRILVLGLEGAGRTIIDGGGANRGWTIQGSAVISSLTFRNTWNALYVLAPQKDVTLSDLLIRDNRCPSPLGLSGGISVDGAASFTIVGSTLVNNTASVSSVDALWLGSGTSRISDTVVWNKTSKAVYGSHSVNATVLASHTFIKGQTLSGTGNLSGALDPRLRADGRLQMDSPLRAAGGASFHSREDLDLEVRPTTPDIGVDQVIDLDVDSIPDGWELAEFGSTTAYDGFDDDDGDGLLNHEEYELQTLLADADSDRDGAEDGFEVANGRDPLTADTEDLVGDLNADGLIDSIGFQLGYSSSQADNDGDSVSNSDELLMCTDPLRSDTDGDGVADNVDPFPSDPMVSALASNPSDTTPPVITLTSPWYAVPQ